MNKCCRELWDSVCHAHRNSIPTIFWHTRSIMRQHHPSIHATGILEEIRKMETFMHAVNEKDEVDWSTVKHFRPEENWGDVGKVNPALIYTLDLSRTISGAPLYISPVDGAVYATSGHSDNSQHYLGNAADIFTAGDPKRFLWSALIIPRAMGIGIYPGWRYPRRNIVGGFHIDVRISEFKVIWWKDQNGVYNTISSIEQLIDVSSQLGGL